MLPFLASQSPDKGRQSNRKVRQTGSDTKYPKMKYLAFHPLVIRNGKSQDVMKSFKVIPACDGIELSTPYRLRTVIIMEQVWRDSSATGDVIMNVAPPRVRQSLTYLLGIFQPNRQYRQCLGWAGLGLSTRSQTLPLKEPRSWIGSCGWWQVHPSIPSDLPGIHVPRSIP